MSIANRFLYRFLVTLVLTTSTTFAGKIHELSASGNAAEVGKLISVSPELIHERCSEGFTPLHYAAAGGHLDVVNLLLSKGADLNAAPERGLEMGKTPLISAIAFGRTNVAAALIARGADMNIRYSHVLYGKGLTVVHAAVLARDMRILRLLLAKEVSPNEVDSKGRTPLVLLLRSQTPRLTDAIARPLVSMLINAKADVNLADDEGLTPLHLAVERGFFDTALQLVRSGADVNAKARDMNTPLKIATKVGDAKMIKMLKDNGAVE